MLIALLLAVAPPAAPSVQSPPPVPRALRPWTTARHVHPSSLFHLTVHDPAAARYLTFALFDDPQPLGLRIVRHSGRYGDVPRQPGLQVTFAQCPGLRGNFEALARLPVPPFFLQGASARPALAAPNQLTYRLEGVSRQPAGQHGRLRLEERGSDGVPPGAIALWSEALARDFERCVQTSLSAEGSGQ